jgi:ankyrin repeat protein
MARLMRLCVVLLSVALLLVTIVRGAGDSPVTKAVKAGDLAAVRKLVAARADVNVTSGDGSTPLLWAAHKSDTEIARVLIAAGAKFDVPNNYGVTPLLEASRTGDVPMIELLLKAGADTKRTHPEGETPLMAASRTGSLPAVQLLLGRGAEVNATDTFQKQTALMWASAEGHLDVVDALLNAGADPNLKAHITSITKRQNADHPTGGFTALMWAGRNGYADVVRRLVKGGADLTLKNGDNASATMVAMYNDRFDLAATLIDLGSDVNDGSLYTAVEMRESTTDQFAFDGSRLRPNHANKTTALDLVKLLMDRGADPHKPFTGQFHSTSMPNGDRFDNSPFFRAAVAADVETLKVMIAHGIDLDRIPVATAAPAPAEDAPADEDAPSGRGRGNPNAGRTAAMVSMNGGRGPAMTGGPGYIRSGTVPYREPGSRKPADAFALLLKAGANPNAKAPDGSTLLHQAAQAGNIDMIRALADAGVKFDEPNKDGLTALDVAEGKRPAGEGARGTRGGAPPAGGGRGRGGRGAAAPQDVAKLLRELMGLPPAPPAPPAPASESPNSAPDGAGGVQ